MYIQSLHKYHAVPFPGNDIKEQTSRWLCIESYQLKFNFTAPTITCPGIKEYELFTITFEPVIGFSVATQKALVYAGLMTSGDARPWKIMTIQLKYTNAMESFLQVARKAPIAALGFRVQCNKWVIIVRLLLREIPERTVFMQKGMEKTLRPYFELTNRNITYNYKSISETSQRVRSRRSLHVSRTKKFYATSNVPCEMSTDLKKGAWNVDEDQKLITYINRYGIWNWSQMPRFAGLSRTGKSCRLRWMNYLRPNVKKGNFSEEEEEIILVSRSQLGNKWSAIASRLPGRSDNDVKNRWHSHLKKRASEQNLVCETTTENNVNSLPTFETENIEDIQQPANHINHFFKSHFSFEEHDFTSSCTATTEDQQFEHISDYQDTGSPGTIDDLRYFWDQLCPLENLKYINDMDHVTSAHAFEDSNNYLGSNDSFYNNDNNSSIFHCRN
nr:putative homeodomain-like protein [Tanacetum cinerariifolium]